ncbi:L-lactate dehydrogenase (cytochrome) [Cohaesibacter sp. ES.047]|uniref:alpha-hydroxy acid oxidase n=1 Tax=Cohaesibacter sp. ES.047 TaxID=1798205 RepID=UPI000BB8DDFB|nr:alpha-hydroxy acid oxidase [Cohaesibacter sp. ES.047]SNY93599.1 L-lactate dehydrogenase (cytochrome) [Cohaesibacter sp. ES.047]
MGFLNYAQARTAAKRRLPKGLFDYIDRGVGEEASLKALSKSLNETVIVPRILSGLVEPELSTTLFGKRYSAPFIIAPTAMAGLIHQGGEMALARAAKTFGIPFCLSTQSLSSVDEVAAAVPDLDLWMQIYLWQDLSYSEQLLKRAWDAGARVAVMTVDTPKGSRKEWNMQSGFDMPFRISPRSVGDLALRPGWLLRVILPHMLRSGLPAMNNFPHGIQPKLLGRKIHPGLTMRRGLSWDDVAWLRDKWSGPLVLKGILAPDDAEKAISMGADGIVVSSHGARNFDASPAPINVLSDISSVCAGRVTVMADSGIRRGLDVLRYQEKGARAVMLGRLPIYALAAEGMKGVTKALEILSEELSEALRYR